MRKLKMLSACFIISILIFILTLSNAKTLKYSRSKRNSLLRSPDTLWCGKANDAETCKDLGKANETDACCREHDNCPYSFSRGEDLRLGYKVANQFATISHCECDVQFYKCLEENSKVKVDEYKYKSYEVLESYKSLEIKCFAHFPCEDNDQTTKFSELWNDKEQRRTGECHKGLKVMEFYDIYDYMKFTEKNLKQKERLIMSDILKRKSHHFNIAVSQLRDVKPYCVHEFDYYPSLISKLFDERLNVNIDTLILTQTQQPKEEPFRKVIFLFMVCNIAIPVIFILAAFCVLKTVEIFT